MGRKVSLSLADLIPRLSYGVIRRMNSEHHEAPFLAHNKHATQLLGEGATKDFILTHIFRISPYLLSRPEDFWREVLRLHYRSAGLPDLLASKNSMVRTVQDAWSRFLSQYGMHNERPPNDSVEVLPEVQYH